jgi:hypothetical protein
MCLFVWQCVGYGSVWQFGGCMAVWWVQLCKSVVVFVVLECGCIYFFSISIYLFFSIYAFFYLSIYLYIFIYFYLFLSITIYLYLSLLCGPLIVQCNDRKQRNGNIGISQWSEPLFLLKICFPPQPRPLFEI